MFLKTHNWGKAARFFQALGFELEFETDHNSGQLRNGDGPYVFIAEVPERRGARGAARAEGRRCRRVQPDPAVEVVSAFEDTHYGHQGDDRAGPRRSHLDAAGAGRRRRVMTDRAGQHRGAHGAVAGAARRGRRAAARARGHVGLQLVAPDDGWRDRPDMDPVGTRGLPGLDRRPRPLRRGPGRRTGRPRRQPVRDARRRPRHLRRAPARPRRPPADLRGRSARRRRRGSGTGWWRPASASPTGCGWCRSTSRRGDSWWDGLPAAGFDPGRPAVVASTGVSMYLTKEATAATLRQLAALAAGSTVAMTFLLAGRARRRGRPSPGSR